MNRVLVLTVVFCGTAITSFEQRSSGILVMEAGNGWQCAGRAIQRGASVPPGAALTGASAESGSVLLDCGSGGWLSYTCKGSGGCRVAACSTQAEGANVLRVDLANQVASKVASSNSLFKYEPKETAVTGVRAPGNPNEAVLVQTATGVHFGPALSRVLEGQYCLRLTRLPAQSGNAPQIVTIAWDRSVDPEGIASTPGFLPGLYSLEKGAPGEGGRCEVAPDAVAAWVLIAPESQFSSLSADWKKVTAQARDLSSSGASREVLVAARHAILASMADSLQSK